MQYFFQVIDIHVDLKIKLYMDMQLWEPLGMKTNF